MQLTCLLAAANVGLSPRIPAPARTRRPIPTARLPGGGKLRAGGRTQTYRGRPPGAVTVELDGQGLLGYRVDHNRDAHIGALAGHR